MKKTIAKGLEKLALSCAIASALGMIAIVGLIVTSVLLRKFANTPLHITEEVVGLLLSVSLFLGLPMVTLQAKHVRVSLIADRLTGTADKLMKLAALAIAIAFFGWLLVETIPWFEFAFKRNIKTETTRILLYPWMALMPLSFVVILMILAARLFGIIDHGGNGEADPIKPESNEAQ